MFFFFITIIIFAYDNNFTVTIIYSAHTFPTISMLNTVNARVY